MSGVVDDGRGMSGRLKLRRGKVVAEQPLAVEVDGERRPAWADTSLLGEMREGDEVVVNTAALDLGLGSGGFDVVHVNLTRGLEGGEGGDEHVIKLNYTSLQHPVDPIESPSSPVPRVVTPGGGDLAGPEGEGSRMTAVILPLHGHLAPTAWAAAGGSGPGASRVRAGYVQTGGGALPGAMGRDVAELRERGLLAGHITAGAAFGGEHEAISVTGALDAAARLGWDPVLVGPGPGIIGSDSEFGHGGMAALDNAHAALALGLPTLISPRLSASDPRRRHRGLSHHTYTVLELLLAPAQVALPEADYTIPTADGDASLLSALEAAPGRHTVDRAPADLDGYAASGLPTRTMARSIDEDPLFFAAPLAAGALAGAGLRRKG